MGSQRLKWQVQALYGSASDPLCVRFECYLGVNVRFLTVCVCVGGALETPFLLLCCFVQTGHEDFHLVFHLVFVQFGWRVLVIYPLLRGNRGEVDLGEREGRV